MRIVLDQQQSLFALSGNVSQCKMKQYIQPFERQLAAMEFSSLCDTDISDDMVQSVPNEVSLQMLKDRLAYWDCIETNEVIPTKQALLEATYYSELTANNELIINRLPNTRILRYGTHDLHEYRGKFFPQLVKSLINIAHIPEGSTVIDPFCGSGTTNVEAAAMDMNSIGIDLNPLSVKIARAKINLLNITPSELFKETELLISGLHDNKCEVPLSSIWDKQELVYLLRWFDENALKEIAYILYCIRKHPNCVLVDFWEVCVSNIIRAISWQKEADLRIRKEIKDYSIGTATTMFTCECQRQLKKIMPYLIILNKEKSTSSRIIEGNTVSIPAVLKSSIGRGDVLITSPPYATALPYLDTDRLSLMVLGLIRKNVLKDKANEMIGNREISERQRQLLWQYYEERKGELTESITDIVDYLASVNHKEGVGFRRRNLPSLLGKYFLDMLDAMRAHIELLNNGAPAFYVVGNNSTIVSGKRMEIKTDKLLWELALNAGYCQVDYISMELLHSRDIFKENRGTSESILFLRKGER